MQSNSIPKPDQDEVIKKLITCNITNEIFLHPVYCKDGTIKESFVSPHDPEEEPCEIIKEIVRAYLTYHVEAKVFNKESYIESKLIDLNEKMKSDPSYYKSTFISQGLAVTSKFLAHKNFNISSKSVLEIFEVYKSEGKPYPKFYNCISQCNLKEILHLISYLTYDEADTPAIISFSEYLMNGIYKRAYGSQEHDISIIKKSSSSVEDIKKIFSYLFEKHPVILKEFLTTYDLGIHIATFERPEAEEVLNSKGFTYIPKIVEDIFESYSIEYIVRYIDQMDKSTDQHTLIGILIENKMNRDLEDKLKLIHMVNDHFEKK